MMIWKHGNRDSTNTNGDLTGKHGDLAKHLQESLVLGVFDSMCKASTHHIRFKTLREKAQYVLSYLSKSTKSRFPKSSLTIAKKCISKVPLIPNEQPP